MRDMQRWEELWLLAGELWHREGMGADFHDVSEVGWAGSCLQSCCAEGEAS